MVTKVVDTSGSSESPQESPTSGSARKPAAAKKRKPAHFGKLDNNEIETPDNVLKAIRDEFGEFFDPCPFVGKGKRPDFDGTTIEWKQFNYVNPPYDKIEPWCIKAIDEARRGKTSMLLVPVRTGTRYWQRYVFPYADQIRFITGKVIFKGYVNPSPHNLALIVYAPNYRITQSPPPLKTHDFNEMFDPHALLKDAESFAAYPELCSVCTAHQGATSGEHTSSDMIAHKQKWAKYKISLRDLVEKKHKDTETGMLLFRVCLPLYYQMCMYELRHRNNSADLEELFKGLSQEELDTDMSLPDLLIRFKSFLLANPRLAKDLFTGQSILPSNSGENLNNISVMLAPWFKDALGFYTAYLDKSILLRAKQMRAHYVIQSEDGEFQQQVMFC